MAVSWGRGGDFKFYTGSSQNNPWTRDLLHKKRIVEEAKLMGFLPKADANKNASRRKDGLVGRPVSGPKNGPQTSTVSSVGNLEKQTIQPTIVPTPREKQQLQPSKRVTKQRNRAHIEQAKQMYQDRKRLGGRLTRKEESAWKAFLETMENGEAPNESRNPSRKFNNGAIPPETLSKSIASFANAPIQTTNGSWQNVNSIALARDSQAIHDRKKAVTLQRRRTQRNKLRGTEPRFNHPLGRSKTLDKSMSEPSFSDSFGRQPPTKLKKADWTTPSVAKIFEPLESEKIGDQLKMKSTYDNNFGARNNASRTKLVGGYFKKM